MILILDTANHETNGKNCVSMFVMQLALFDQFPLDPTPSFSPTSISLILYKAVHHRLVHAVHNRMFVLHSPLVLLSPRVYGGLS